MTDKEFEKMMEEKRKDAATPGYGARCAAKALQVKRSRNADATKQHLLMS